MPALRRALPLLLLALLAGCRAPAGERARAEDLLRAGRAGAAEKAVSRLEFFFPRDAAVTALSVKVACAERRLGPATDRYRRFLSISRRNSRDLLLALLFAALRDPDPRIACLTLRAGGELALDTVRGAAYHATFDDNAMVRATAYFAWSRLPNHDTAAGGRDGWLWMAPALLEEADPRVRAATYEAIARCGDTSAITFTRIGALESGGYAGWQYARMRAFFGDRRMLEQVRLEVDTGDAVLAAEGAATLVRLGERRYLAVLARSLRHPDPGVRAAAATGLGEAGHRDYFDTLVAVAGDSSPDVRYSVAYALGEMGDARGATAAQGLLGDREDFVRAEAAVALARLAPAASEHRLSALIADSSLAVRISAVAALLALTPR